MKSFHNGSDWSNPALAVFSASAGFAVGNLYLAQPLLADIAASLGVTTDACGFLMTATQIGYALGILLIVPLGDSLNRRVLIPLCMTVSAIALALCSLAPSLGLLAAALSALGLSTVAGQIIIPLVRDKSSKEKQGSAVGVVAAGVTLGVLIARAVSGLIADALGWRTVYLIVAAANLILALTLRFFVPSERDKHRTATFSSPLSLVKLLRENPVVLPIMATTGLVFGICFNAFWNGITFLLSSAPFEYDPLEIGLVSLTAAVGAVASLGIGKLLDKGYGLLALRCSVAVVAVGLVLVGVGQTNIVIVVIAAAVLSLGVQGVGVLSQTLVISAVPGKSSLLNTAFVFNNFVMAAVGSTLASVLWYFGWTVLVVAMLIATGLALAINLAFGKDPMQV